MTVRSAGLAASLALAANAFIIPSTMSVPGVDVDALNPAGVPQDGSAKIVKLPCPGCSFESAEGREDVENAMVLNWSLDQEGKTLMLNGRDFYGSPLASWAQGFPTAQVPSTASLDDIRQRFDDVATKPRDVYFGVFERFTHAADGTEAQLIDMDLTVNALGDEQVHGADGLTLRILKGEDGRLAIADVVQVPADKSKPAHDGDEGSDESEEQEQTFNILPVDPTAPPTVPMEHKMDCEGRMKALCQVKAMMQQQMDAMRSAMHATGRKIRIIFIGKPPHRQGMRPQHRPCRGGHRGGPPGVPVRGGLPKFSKLSGASIEMEQQEGSHPHPHGHGHGHFGGRGRHGHRMGCRRMQRFLHAMRRIFFGFVVPVLIGIAAGMSASLLGMVVGTGLAMFWIRCVRGGRRGNASARMAIPREEVVVDSHEKMGLMEEELHEGEELPAYEDHPVATYVDKEAQQ